MHVAASPAFADSFGNRYTGLLYTALQELDVTVEEWRPTLRQPSVDIVHLHWPEIPVNLLKPSHAAVRTSQLLSALAAARARGARVVWTAHNTQSHTQRRPATERAFWRVFDRLIDGWLTLSSAAVPEILHRHPRLARVPHAVTPHGHYRGAYADTTTRAEARGKLGLDSTDRVLCFLGQVRPYKGVNRLVDVFRAMPEPDLRLLVAGRADETTAQQITAAAAGDKRIRLSLAPVPDDELQLWLRAADVAVFPYEGVLNSGSALLALSFDLPVLAPSLGAIPELSATVPRWLQLYTGELTADHLRAALTNRPAGRPDLTPLDWAVSARQTLALYDEIARPRAR